jgi:CBS domain-containing protein
MAQEAAGSIIEPLARKESIMTTTYARHRHPARSLEAVTVSEAMHRGVVTCRPETPLHTLARLMAAHRIHAVVVAGGIDSQAPRLVSDLDLVAAAADGAIDGLTVGEVATEPSVFVWPDESLARAAKLMREHKTHHLVVLGRSADLPVGVISTLDVADAVAELPRASFTSDGARS